MEVLWIVNSMGMLHWRLEYKKKKSICDATFKAAKPGSSAAALGCGSTRVCVLSECIRFTSKSGFQWGWSLTYSAETEPACLRAQLVHLKSYPLDCTTSILHGHRFHSDFREIRGEA